MSNRSVALGEDSFLQDVRWVVSDEHRFAYLVTPKVACTSIKTALLPLFGRDPVEAGARKYVHGILAQEGAMIAGGTLIGGMENRYQDYFKFSFVRNPFDRLVSCYYSKINARMVGIEQEPHEGAELWPGMSFKDFVGVVCRIPDEKANVHFRSQHLTLIGPKDDLVVDFLGRFEALEEGFEHISKEIGASLSLPHSNPSKRRQQRDYRSVYNDELAAAVGERYQTDCRLFGYSF